MQDDASTQTMSTGDETGHNFHPSYSHSAGSSHTSETPQSDVVVDDKQNEKPIPGSSVSKKNESSQAWKKNMISLNEDMETGPSQLFQNEDGGSRITASESATVNALHNTKLFIPALSSPQHSTSLKNNDKVSTVSESGPIKRSVSNERDVLSEQRESSAAEVRKESTTSSASVVHQLELQPSGSMLTPPGISNLI